MGDEVEEEGKEDDSYIPSQDDLLGGSAKNVKLRVTPSSPSANLRSLFPNSLFLPLNPPEKPRKYTTFTITITPPSIYSKTSAVYFGSIGTTEVVLKEGLGEQLFKKGFGQRLFARRLSLWHWLDYLRLKEGQAFGKDELWSRRNGESV